MATPAGTFWTARPGYFNLAMMKNFRVRERKNFQLRFESFNALNHPNFCCRTINLMVPGPV